MVATATNGVGVGLGELQVVRDGELIAYSLGSCVAICLHDPQAKVAGMAHVVLPAVPEKGAGGAPGKYGDTAVSALLEAMKRAGASLARLECCLAGGAAVLAIGGTGTLPPIGKRNVESVKAALDLARLRVRAEDTGGTQGRTVRLDAVTGRVLVRKVSGPEVEL